MKLWIFVVDLIVFIVVDRGKIFVFLFFEGVIVFLFRIGYSFIKISVERVILFGGIVKF